MKLDEGLQVELRQILKFLIMIFTPIQVQIRPLQEGMPLAFFSPSAAQPPVCRRCRLARLVAWNAKVDPT